MLVYRIVKTNDRTKDLSGTGAYRFGGRWNSKGVYMLYTSASSSLALLETLVHQDRSILPSHMYLMEISFNSKLPIHTLDSRDYPGDWKLPGSLLTKAMGDKWMLNTHFLGFRARSAVNPFEFNYLLNPSFPDYKNLLKVERVVKIPTDDRLFNTTL
jgi:RES domain-containing protein